jgi:uncharacterized membrane protein
MSRRFPRGLAIFCTGELLFLYINFGKNINFTNLPFKNHLTKSNANSILYNLRGSSLHMKRLKAQTQRTFPGDFHMAWSFFVHRRFVLFLYKFWEKNINFTSLPFKNRLTNSDINSILYNFGGSYLNVIKPKALKQVICPGDFRVALSFFAQASCFFSI